LGVDGKKFADSGEIKESGGGGTGRSEVFLELVLLSCSSVLLVSSAFKLG